MCSDLTVLPDFCVLSTAEGPLRGVTGSEWNKQSVSLGHAQGTGGVWGGADHHEMQWGGEERAVLF